MTRIFFPFVMASVLGCTSVKTTPYPNSSPMHYRTILVIVNTGDEELRAAAESSFVVAGMPAGVEFIPRDKVLVPGRKYSDFEIMDRMIQLDIPAAIVISDAPIPTLAAYSLPTTLQDQTRFSTDGQVTGDRFTVVTRVFDAMNGEFVWTADTEVRRRGANDRAIMRKFAEDIVRELQIDGVIRGRRDP